jgi:hypothetical protein
MAALLERFWTEQLDALDGALRGEDVGAAIQSGKKGADT